MGIAIIPELAGNAVAEGTLETMAARVAQEIPKKVVIGLKLNEEIHRIQDGKMGQRSVALAAGLPMGRVLQEAQNTVKQNPEAYEKVQNTIADIKPSIDKINDLAGAINTVTQDINTEDIEEALDNLPDKYQEMIELLTID